MRKCAPPKRYSLLLGIVLMLLGCLPVKAFDSLRLASIWILADNDHFRIADKSDKFYTSGLYLGMNSGWRSRQRPFGLLNAPKEEGAVRYGLTLAHLIFTPTNVHDPELMELDYPYSSVATLSFLAESENDSWAYTIGMRGPIAMGEPTQTLTHSIFGYPEPKGWQDQLPNRIVANASWQHRSYWFQSQDGYMAGVYHLQAGNIRTAGMLGFKMHGSWKIFSLTLESFVEGLLYNGQIKEGWSLYNPNLHAVVAHFRFNGYIDLGKVKFQFGQWFISSEIRSRESHGWGRLGIFWKL